MENPVRRCKDCGAALPEGTGNRRLYCDSCRKLRKKETDLAWYQKRSARQAKKPPVVRYCTVCGKELPVGSAANRKYCLFCSEKVHRESALERSKRVWATRTKIKKPAPPSKAAPEKKLSPSEHRKVDKPCKECGTMMYGVDPGKMFCDACKKRRCAKPGTDTGTQPIIVKPKTNHDLLVDDNAAAAAKGMSYGHFKQWQRRQKELKERGEIY